MKASTDSGCRTGPASRRAVAGVAAIVVTSMVLVMLVGLKVASRPVWRASARVGLTSCMRGHWSPRSGDRLHRTGRLGRCAARLEPVRTEYLELATAGLLVALLAGEVVLLTHDRCADGRHGTGRPKRRPAR
jgi:hypothetical protein